MYQLNGRKVHVGKKSVPSFSKKVRKTSNYKVVILFANIPCSSGSGDNQQRVVPEIAGSILICAGISLFSCSILLENSGSVKNRRSKAEIFPALIREIFSRRGPLSSGVIMCMYGNFTFRLVTMYLHMYTRLRQSYLTYPSIKVSLPQRVGTLRSGTRCL